MRETTREDAAARDALGLAPDADETALDAAFRARAAPLIRAAADDRAASDALRRLIESRARLRPLMRARDAPRETAAADPSVAPGAIVARGFRLAENRRDVEIDIALADVVAAAEDGRLFATLTAPVLRRCPACAAAGHATCGHCRGAGVTPTSRMRAAPLDLQRLAADDFAVEASPWADACGRGARGGPIFRARLI